MTTHPWGLTRVTDRLPIQPSAAVTGPVLDPDTQLARYFDGSGQPIEMGAHGTNRSHGTTTQSSSGGDGAKPGSTVNDDNNTDYSSD